MTSAWRRDWASDPPSGPINLSPGANHNSSGMSLSPASHQASVDSSQQQYPSQSPGFAKPGKRPRAEGSRAAMSYPRKRAVTACEICRVRKRKCNNARPKCKFCEDAGVDCNYGSRGDQSSFDPASLVMIDKLNDIIQRLDEQHPRSSAFGLSDPDSLNDLAYRGTKLGPPDLPGPSESPSSRTFSHAKAGDGDLDGSMEIPSFRTTADTLLLWPVFEGRYPPEYLVDTLFRGASEDVDSEQEQSSLSYRMRKTASARPSFREDEVNDLVENFLSHVHIKNPILEIDTLKGYARRVVEEGPGWDGGSCLVFLACALGALARPFQDCSGRAYDSAGDGALTNSVTIIGRELEIAESNYALATRRIGLLKCSILRSQCYFWSGVYLMYTMRPVEAWEKFFHASSTYHIYLKGHLTENEQSDLYVRRTRLLEQRLYWSCFKSECEIRVELNLPGSSIGNIKYPDMFPSPPNAEASGSTPEVFSTPTPSENASNSVHDEPTQRARQLSSFSRSLENSWYYYLSEIALRRIGNNVLNTFYTSDRNPGSDMSIQIMVKTATNFLDQLSQWYDGLPAAIKYNQDDYHELPQDELAYFTRGRALEIRTWLFRPFLYYAIHHSPDDPHRAVIQLFVDEGLEAARATMRDATLNHRHHGTWFQLRVGTGAALTMIAAFKCGHIDLPPDWGDIIRTQISVLRFWENESPDILKAKDLLNDLMMECESG